VESIPGKVSGAWVLKGTRMPVSAIFENLEEGANIDDIMQWYEGLDREQVKAVIEFAVRSLATARTCGLDADLLRPGNARTGFRIDSRIATEIRAATARHVSPK
jgi:uncharacterized protein (DUF433 family)